VANARAELDAAALPFAQNQQGIDTTHTDGRTMIQMASEQERQIIRSKVLAGLDRVRPTLPLRDPRSPPSG
jgi:DNA invertase Pin-like site-specific DNA recombinase